MEKIMHILTGFLLAALVSTFGTVHLGSLLYPPRAKTLDEIEAEEFFKRKSGK